MWDTFPDHIGIIDHINYDKGKVHFIVNKTIDGLINLSEIKEKVEIGSRLLLKLKQVSKLKDSYYSVLSHSVTQQDTTEKVLSPFHGIVRIHDSIGFVGDVYIESGLIQAHEIHEGMIINGTAIINYNKKKGIWGWRAIAIRSLSAAN